MKHRQILTWFREKTAETILGVKKTKTNSRADDVPELQKYLTFSGHRRAGRTLIPKCPKVPFRKKKKSLISFIHYPHVEENGHVL